MFIPKCICILSAYPYLVAFREYLTQLDRLTKIGDMKLPLERYIVNFCAEIPAPPPGSFEVQAMILNSVISMWTPPHNQPIAWVSLPFSHLFECLDIDNIVTVWHALALEKQVLVVSSQLTLLTTACEILTSFLFPMRWSHAYIPLLPRFLMPILAAPTSFLIGVDRRYFNEALQHLSNDCIVVDLDKNQVNLGTQVDNIPRIPQWFEKELKDVLKQNAGMIYREARSLRKEDDYSDRGQFLKSHVKEMSDAMWESKLSLYDGAFHLAFTPETIKNPDFLNGNDNSGMGEIKDVSSTNSLPQHIKKSSRVQSKWDSVQEAFLLVYVDLLQNYRKSLVFPSKDVSSSSIEPDGNNSAFGDFKSKDFLKSQRYEKRRFLAELVKTQMFDDFITKRLYGSGASDVTFFDQAIDKYVKHSISSAMDPVASISPISSPQRENRSSTNVPDMTTVKRLIGRVRSRHYFCLSDSGEPLLQSAKIRRGLKTVVPPEPNCEGLPNDTESTYIYEPFPSKLDKSQLCEPRPLPPVVIAEFDRQKEDAAHFRKKLKMLQKKVRKSAQEATFTVFFVAYSAMIGRELIELYHDALMTESAPDVLPSSTTDSDSLYTAADSDSEFGDEFKVDEVHRRARFIESISSAKVEEAKAIGRAQLNLAFEILDIMKERQCNTEPAAYKYLIDACGRCGDTDRATQVLKRMHEDGVIADGVVYSCLVSAFSVENSFGKRPHEESVPGKFCFNQAKS
jgi:pentatricopeptide repeat protein